MSVAKFLRKVNEALEDGFNIQSKGILCWVPIPPPELVPKVRALMIGLESTFTFTLGVVKPKKDHGLGMASMAS